MHFVRKALNLAAARNKATMFPKLKTITDAPLTTAREVLGDAADALGWRNERGICVIEDLDLTVLIPSIAKT